MMRSSQRCETKEVTWSRGGQHFRLAVTAEDSGGSFSLTDITIPGGTGAGVHSHEAAEECFYVLDGKYRFVIGGEEVFAGAGETVLVPRGTPHSFVVGDEGGHHLTIFAPAGCERAFSEIGAAMEHGDTSPEFWAALGARTKTRFNAHEDSS